MPKPLLLTRPSGLYARFLVPVDLRAVVGSRFVVRPLYVPRGDAARLVAARLGVALSVAFKALRRGQVVDLKKALEAAAAAGRLDLTLEGLTLPDGTRIDRAQLDTPEDMAMFAELLESRRAQMKEGSARIAAAAPQKQLRLSMAVALHLGDLQRAKLAAKTLMESRHTLRIFTGVVGETVAVSDLSQEHARAFFDAVRWWPSNATKRKPYKGLEVLEVIALGKANNVPEPADWTVSKHRQRLNVFFVSLIASGDLGKNPLAGLRGIATPDAEDRGAPFSDDELQAIFGPAFVPWASKYPHRWFGPMLGLYSGARVNEVAQLRVEDVDTVDGVPGFFIRAAAKGQRVKNKNSRRFVPLAQPVLDAGFLAYVEEAKAAGHAQLFPNLPNSTGLGFGRQLSRQFSAYIKSQGVEEKGQGFHGFRHTLADRLDAAGASAAAIGALTGHAAGQTVLEKHYIHRSTLPDRVATLAKFAPLVELPAYTPQQFAAALKAARPRGARRAPPRA